MPNLELFNNGTHRNILLEDFDGGGLAVQSNQHVIVHGDSAMMLDPGGHKIYSKVLAETFSVLGRAKLTDIFLSHQDPDIVAAVNGWLMTTDATAYVSGAVDALRAAFRPGPAGRGQVEADPRRGPDFRLAGAKLLALPAHFLHSEGNFQLYDPTAKILYSGDLGASIGMEYREVADFDAHLRYMEGFHRRYMCSRIVMRAWADMVRPSTSKSSRRSMAPCSAARTWSTKFIDWCADLECGVDLITPKFKIPVA